MEPGWKVLKGGAGMKTMLIVLAMAASMAVVVLREESPFAGYSTQAVLSFFQSGSGNAGMFARFEHN